MKQKVNIVYSQQKNKKKLVLYCHHLGDLTVTADWINKNNKIAWLQS